MLEAPPPVYVLDDDPSVRKALRRLLCATGREVETFSSATELLAEVSLEEPADLLLDLRLPGMSGLELLDRLGRNGHPLRVVVMTAYAQPGERKHALSHGAAGFLTKPFEEEELLGLLTIRDDRL